LGEAPKVDDSFKWYSTIQLFIKELNMKEKEVYKLNYIHSLNWLSFFYQRNKAQEAANNTTTKKL